MANTAICSQLNLWAWVLHIDISMPLILQIQLKKALRSLFGSMNGTTEEENSHESNRSRKREEEKDKEAKSG